LHHVSVVPAWNPSKLIKSVPAGIESVYGGVALFAPMRSISVAELISATTERAVI